MNRKTSRSRGYSLSELLTVVAIVGLITMIAVPAFMQILPQYRIRGAASEIAAWLRILRARAVSTRSEWRMRIDPTIDAYSLQRNNAGTWVAVTETGLPAPTGLAFRSVPAVNVAGTAAYDIVFKRDGTITSSTTQNIVVNVNNSRVAFNTYTIRVTSSGTISITPTKVSLPVAT